MNLLVKGASDIWPHPGNLKTDRGLTLSPATNTTKQIRARKKHRKDRPATRNVNYDVRQTVSSRSARGQTASYTNPMIP
jgi:hypothetical protein